VLYTDGEQARLVAAMPDSRRSLVREAITLQGFEEARHAELLR